MMHHILHVPYCFYPDAMGGTEIYVLGLARALQKRGVTCLIAAPALAESEYAHEGLSIYRYKVSPQPKELAELYGEGDEAAAGSFGRLLDKQKPTLVHFHAFTRGVSTRCILEAKKRNIRTVFTYHTPTVTCQRGTLMRWGKKVCDGRIRVGTCSRCVLNGLGLPLSLAGVVGSIPPSMGRLLERAGCSGGAWTALQMPNLMRSRRRSVGLAFENVDHVVATARWVQSVLLANDVPLSKITVSRQGFAATAAFGHASDRAGLKIAVMGRLEPVKGTHLLISALRSLPVADVRLDIYGIAQGQAGETYFTFLKKISNGDKRINFHSSFEQSRVLEVLSRSDVLAVPSMGVETGPLVALEAFAAGIPVMGSDIGGISETVEHEKNGLLVKSGSIPAWTAAIRRLCDEPGLLNRLTNGVKPPRSMETVADEMLRIYRGLS